MGLEGYTHMRSIALILFAFGIVAACTAKYPVVGSFDRYNETFIGQVDHNLALGTATIVIEGKNSGIQCRGASRVTEAALTCSGQGGVADFTCDDGTTATARWTATSCTTGYGFGTDDRGRGFQFAFGMSEGEAQRFMRREQEATASLPTYETYRPKETRKQLGFSTGTGFLISANGLIVTNYHVVDGADEIFVIVGDRQIRATVREGRPLHDIVVLQADVSGAPISIGDSDRVGVADEVMTLGYPLIQQQGQAQKATFGRVNALSGVGDDERFLQIDVPIQPGNSGGPLFNSRGEVVGIVTATLDDIETLANAGVVPQNVNYAVKAKHLEPATRNIQRPPRPTKELTFKEIVARYKDSVYLIVATSRR